MIKTRYIPYRFLFGQENIVIYALLVPADNYPLTNVDGYEDLSNFYNCVEDAIMSEVDRIGAQEQFYADTKEEAIEFLEQALCGIASLILFDMDSAKRLII